MKTFYLTPDHHIELIQVKDYNRRQTVNHMKFMLDGEPRQRGWVVDVANKNGVGTRQRFAYNYEEAITFAELNYGVTR